MNYTGQRDLGAALTTGIAGGNLPDVAGLPGPGLMQQWYADGALKPLDFVDFAAYEAATPPGFAALGKAPDGKLAGIFTKGAVKGLIWYNTGDLDRATAPGHVGRAEDRRREPGDRRHEGVVHRPRVRRRLRLAGHGLDRGHRPPPGRPRRLRRLGRRDDASGPIPPSRRRWRTFGDAVANALRRLRRTSNGTNFGKAANPLFADPPGCLLHHQASFITDFFKNEARRQARPTTTSSRSPTSTRHTRAA